MNEVGSVKRSVIQYQADIARDRFTETAAVFKILLPHSEIPSNSIFFVKFSCEREYKLNENTKEMKINGKRIIGQII